MTFSFPMLKSVRAKRRVIALAATLGAVGLMVVPATTASAVTANNLTIVKTVVGVKPNIEDFKYKINCSGTEYTRTINGVGGTVSLSVNPGASCTVTETEYAEATKIDMKVDGTIFEYEPNKRRVSFPQPNSGNVTVNVTNTYAPRPSVKFIKAICASYDMINANEEPNNTVEVGAHNPGSNFSDKLKTGALSLPVSASEIPAGCELPTYWRFNLGTGFERTTTSDGHVVSSVTTDRRTVHSNGPELLTQAETNVLAKGGKLWVSEFQKDGYGFGALRCFNDALKGDNIEHLAFNPFTISSVTCIAYNVKPTIYIRKEVTGPAPADAAYDFTTTCFGIETMDSVKAGGHSAGRRQRQNASCTITETGTQGATTTSVEMDNAKNVVVSNGGKTVTFDTPMSGEVVAVFTNAYVAATSSTTTVPTTIVSTTTSTSTTTTTVPEIPVSTLGTTTSTTTTTVPEVTTTTEVPETTLGTTTTTVPTVSSTEGTTTIQGSTTTTTQPLVEIGGEVIERNPTTTTTTTTTPGSTTSAPGSTLATSTTQASVAVQGVVIAKAQAAGTTTAKTGTNYASLLGLSSGLVLVGAVLAFLGRRSPGAHSRP